MTSRDFCFWLQGFFELNPGTDGRLGLTPEQSSIVRRHLSLVFKHEIDPSMAEPADKTPHQQALDAAHATPPQPAWVPPGLTMRC